MITTEKVTNVNMERTRVVLTSNGYISGNGLYRIDFNKLYDDYGIIRTAIPSPDDLRDMAGTPENNIDCRCLVFENGKKSYWYKVSDLIKVFQENPCKKPNRRKKVRDIIIFAVVMIGLVAGILCLI